MTISQLKCFASLIMTRRITEAAHMCGISVSSLSKYIDSIEAECSVKLFHKTSHGLELTREGGLIYPNVQFILKTYDDMISQMNKLTNTEHAPLQIALSFHQVQILKKLLNFLDSHSDISIVISEEPSLRIRNMLDFGRVDIAITYEELLEKKYRHVFPLHKEKLVAVVGSDHPLAQNGHVSISMLSSDIFYLSKFDILMYRFQIHTCVAAGFVPNESPHNFHINALMDFISANSGVALMTETMAKNVTNQNTSVLLLDENPLLTLSLVSPATYIHESCRRLIEYLGGY